MKTIQQKRKEWLDSHLAPYLADPSKRALQGAVCAYRTTDGKKCIVGQDIPDKKYIEKMDGISNSAVDCNSYVIDALPKKTKDLGIDFLKTAQQLHDRTENWNDTGLSMHGQRSYEGIISDYCTI